MRKAEIGISSCISRSTLVLGILTVRDTIISFAGWSSLAQRLNEIYFLYVVLLTDNFECCNYIQQQFTISLFFFFNENIGWEKSNYTFRKADIWKLEYLFRRC